MNKDQIIESAANQGISVKEITYGIWNPEPAYSFAPASSTLYQYREGMYHVSCDLSRSELISGVRLMAARMKIELKSFPAK